MKSKYLFKDNSWTIPGLEKAWKTIDKIAKNEYGLDYYPVQLEIVTYAQMLDLYCTSGLPSYYHWSFGRSYIEMEREYKRKTMGLAYELVINTNPCIAYLKDTNNATEMMTVLCHAAVGHNAFFKGNYLFKEFTDPKDIFNFIETFRKYVIECEGEYGTQHVSDFITAVHMLKDHGVFKYNRKYKSKKDKAIQTKEKKVYNKEAIYGDFRQVKNTIDLDKTNSIYPHENVLYIIEKEFQGRMEPWELEIIRGIRKIAQYFYPQRQDKLMNEGYASFWHYELMKYLYDNKYMTEGQYIEFLKLHSSVARQPLDLFKHEINPYKLGYMLWKSIRDNNENWKEVFDHALGNFCDESFVLQYLTEDIAKELQLCSYDIDLEEGFLEITSTLQEGYFKQLKKDIATTFSISYNIPNVEVQYVDHNNQEFALHFDRIDELEMLGFTHFFDCIEAITEYDVLAVEHRRR